MATVFVSYRTADSTETVERLCDRLRAALGKDQVFRDRNAIEIGNDYRVAIDDALESCDVLLAVIGEDWMGPKPDGRSRMSDEDDYVRFEIEKALAGNAVVIPVLLGLTPMPKAIDIPPSLEQLTYRQATNLRSDPDFDFDVARILRRIPGASPKSFKTNVLLVAMLLLVIPSWILLYAGPWGLATAALALVPFPLLFGLMFVFRKRRAEAIRLWIDRKILIGKWTTHVLSCCLFLALLTTAFLGTISIKRDENDTTHLKVEHDDDGERHALDVGTNYHVFWTTLWSPRDVTVRVDGLPRKVVRLRPYQRLTLEIPHAFIKRVLLVRSGTLFLADTAFHNDEHSFVMQVYKNNILSAEAEFDGQSVYIGCEKATGVPEALRTTWRQELVDGNYTAKEKTNLMPKYWTKVGNDLESFELEPKDKIRIDLIKMSDSSAGGTLFGRSKMIEVNSSRDSRFSPQVITIEVQED
ncbi:MAG: toll/interleukin-1 receptor domain-containing protein [Planctomycetota bacterium]